MLGIYCRVSKVKGKDEDTSIPVQKKNGVLLAEKLNIKYEFFVDDGISGTKEEVDGRPEFARMFKAIKDKKISAVYVQYQDRLERHPLIWQLFVSIVLKNDCKFYPGGVLLDLNNPQNRYMSDVLSANSSLYAKLTSIRVKDSIKARASEGKFRGITAFGYMHGKDKKLEINSREAKVVKKIFNLSLSGMGTYLIANKLNEEKVPTRFNGLSGTHKRKDSFTNKVSIFEKKDVRWRGNVIYDMLVNPIYKGQKTLNGKIYTVPAIIDENTWDKANANLVKNKKNVGKKAEYKYLLNSLIVCSCCGRDFVGKKRLASNDNAYKCKGKIYPNPICSNSRGISINKLDSFIIKHLFLSKSLKKYLQNLPNNSEEHRGLQVRLTKEKQVLARKVEELNVAYKRLLSPAFKDDAFIESEVTTLKGTVERQKALVEKLENEVVIQEATNRKKRTNELMNRYVGGAKFSDIRSLVHGLIEYIKIEHQKEEGKMGNYLVEIKYKGYEEKSTFLTNWQAQKWLWLSKYRSGANDSATLENDREELIGIMEYYGIEITPKTIREFKKSSGLTDEEINKMNPLSDEFAGLEVVEGIRETVEINDDELVYFD